MKVLRKIPFVILLLPLVAAIVIWHYLRKDNTENFEQSKAIYQVQITSIPQTRDKTIKVEADIVWRQDSNTFHLADGKLMLYIHRDSLSETLRQGDSLIIRGNITHFNKGNPYEFDYDGWLESKGFKGVIFLDETEWILCGHRNIYTIKAIAERCRHWFVELLEDHGLHDEELGVVAAMTVGERAELDQQTRSKYSAAGAMHVLAVSGLHTAIVYSAILFLLSGLGFFPILYKQRKRQWITSCVALLFIWCYAFLTGMSPSVMRAALMITIFQFAQVFGRKGISANTLAATAFINLMIEPEALFSISFQLSYAAVAGILVFTDKISGLINIHHWLPRQIWGLLAVSIAAQLGTIPVTLWYFQQTSNYFALTNFIVIPLAYIIIFLAIALVIFSGIPYLGVLTGSALKWVAFGMNWCVGFIENIPLSTANVSITPWMLVCLIIAITFIGIWIHQGKWWWLATSGCMLIIIASLHWLHLKEIENTDRRIVYNTYPYTLLLEQKGRSCTLHTDDIEAAMSVSEPLRKQMMIKNVQTDEFKDKEAYLFVCDDKQILYLAPGKGKSLRIKETTDADIVLLGGKGQIETESVLKNCQAETVVILSNMPEWRREETKTVAKKATVEVKLTSNGAIEL